MVRLVGCTVAGQLLDTDIFTLVAFTASGFMSGPDMVKFIIQGWIFKTLVEIVMLPVTYRVVGYLKKSEHQDAIDSSTNFNPLSLKV